MAKDAMEYVSRAIRPGMRLPEIRKLAEDSEKGLRIRIQERGYILDVEWESGSPVGIRG